MEGVEPSGQPKVGAKWSIDAEGARSPDDGNCRHGSTPRVRECECIPAGVSGESDGAVENALLNGDLDFDAEGPADKECTQSSGKRA